MSGLSVVIPSRNELFLENTVRDILTNSRGELEIIVVLDGYWPNPPLPDDRRISIIHRGKARGMRDGINSAISIARNKFVMKCDAHCLFAEGFDEILKADCDDDWVVIPRRYSLNPDTWGLNKKTPVDYHFLSYPWWKPEMLGLHGTVWTERAKERLHITLDEEMSFQGSCWFTTKDHFINRIRFLEEEGYETFIGEPQEVGNKTWLGGGKVMVNKKTYYAHLHKGKRFGRGYFMSKDETYRGNQFSWNFWFYDQWSDRIHDLSWLVDRFWPVPSWPENWKDIHENDIRLRRKPGKSS